jgi:DMSO/TMAO reductase YedYZ heme-binding membrane subunit
MFQRWPTLITLIVIAIFSWYYFIQLAFPVTLGFVNAVVAFSATIMIALSYLWGPLARFIPVVQDKVWWRKWFGLYGFGLAALHSLIAIVNLLSVTREITLADVGSLAFAAMGFVLFTLIATTSTHEWQKHLGLNNWKSLQRLGYLGLIFIFAHILLLEQGVFLGRTSGQFAFTFIFLVFVLRAITLILPSAKKT